MSANRKLPRLDRSRKSAQLKDAMAIAAKQNKDRKLDLILLTIGANDIWFAGLVGDVITEPGTERTLFEKGGMITDVPYAQKILDGDLPSDFAKVRAALKPFIGGNLSRVVYRHLRQSDAGEPEQRLPRRPRRL